MYFQSSCGDTDDENTLVDTAGEGRRERVRCMERVTWKHALPHDPTIPLPGMHPEKTITEKDMCIPVFTAGLFTIARTWKQPGCPSTDERIKKLWYIHTMKHCSALKRMHLSSCR